MVVKLAKYLNSNGYDKKSISILTLYMKQALIIKKMVQDEGLYGIRV